ncbi:MAG TPA: hypothetical protein DCK87_03200 [Desulfotomaculum sp.]|nr:hypothetical protein [Desulfotomaculum sp.]
MEEFYLVEEILTPLLEKKQKKGIYTSLSPVIKEKNEVLQGSLLFLDLLDDVYLLYDKENFFKNYLSTLKERLKDLRGKKIYRSGGWYCLLEEEAKKIAAISKWLRKEREFSFYNDGS